MSPADLPSPSPSASPAATPSSSPASSWIDAGPDLWWSEIPESCPAERARKALDRAFWQWSREESDRLVGPDVPVPVPPLLLPAAGSAGMRCIDEAERREPALVEGSPNGERRRSATWLAEIEARNHGDDVVLWLARRRHRAALVWRWQETDPEYIRRAQEHLEREHARSACLFVHHPMCRPGVLVELLGFDGEVDRRVLGGGLGGEARPGSSRVDADVHPYARVLRYLDLLGTVRSLVDVGSAPTAESGAEGERSNEEAF